MTNLDLKSFPKSRVEQATQRLFQALSYVFFVLIFVVLAIPFVLSESDLAVQLPFISNSAVMMAVLWLLSLYIAGNVQGRRGLISVFIIGHFISLISLGLFLLFADTGAKLAIGSFPISVYNIILIGIILDTLTLIPVLILFNLSENRFKSLPIDKVTGSDRRFKFLLIFFAALFGIAAVGYHIGPYFEQSKPLFVQLPWVSNSVVKVSLLALCCWYAARDLSRNVAIVNIVIWGHIISVIGQSIYFFFRPTSAQFDMFFGKVSIAQVLGGAIGLDILIIILLIWQYQSYWKRLFNNPTFLRPTEYRALMALSDVIIEGGDGQQEIISPKDIAANVDSYVGQMTARRKWIYRVSMYVMQVLPLLFGRSPFSEMDKENRKSYLENHFYNKKGGSGFISNYLKAIIRIAQQISFVGYYGDSRSHDSIGYKTFSHRERYKDLIIPEPVKHPLDVLLPRDINEDSLETEVCIVGSGAAGAILAYELAKKGHKVLLLEKGRYIEPQYFTEDEVEMIGKLYGEGVFQQTEDFKFTILQGNCVGGSTVVNNAVCFDPPSEIINQWNDEFEAKIDTTELAESLLYIRKILNISEQKNVQLNPGDTLIQEGIKKYDPNGKLLETGIVDANIQNCFGCGYCNIGCKYGKKLSMLDTILPLTQKSFPGKLRILSECKVDKLYSTSGKPHSVSKISATLSNGKRIDIKTDKVVLSAGTIASSYILKQSGIGQGLPVGKNLCFNVGSPVYGVFDRVINAHDGLQIAHYYKPLQEEGIIMESWWNPPASQSINMPGWFNDHFQNMKNYNKSLAIGVLVASKSTGVIVNALTGGPGVNYVPDEAERTKLWKGLTMAGEILFAAGAKKVMYNGWTDHTYTSVEQLGELKEILLKSDNIALGTGHPQGGNRLGSQHKEGVLDENFKIHGYDNLHVCDGSIFPTSVGVNPQLTIMALAHYASKRI